MVVDLITQNWTYQYKKRNEPVEKITQKMIEATSLKFQKWDQMKGTQEGLRMLLDPTVFAYAFLKNEQGTPLKLRPFQDILINDPNRFVVCASANQVGKSLCGEVKILHHILFVPNATVLVSSKNDTLAKKILTDIREICLRSNFDISDIEEKDNMSTITIRNWDGLGVSKVVAVAPTFSGISYPATLVFLDEAGFMENGTKLYNQVFMPRTFATKNWKNKDGFTMGQIFVISNPYGKQGLLWNLWERTEFSKYRFNYLANPDNTIEEYENLRMSMPSDEFNSTAAAVFTSSSGAFITMEEYKRAISKSRGFDMPNDKIFGIGLDLAGEDVVGRKLDRNVMYIGYKERIILGNSEQDHVVICGRKEWPSGTSRKTIATEIKRMFDIYPIYSIVYDKPGVGDSFKNQLMDMEIPEYKIESLTYSLPNKSEVYYNLKMLYEQGRIAHPDIPVLESQFSTLDFTKTMSGHLQNPKTLIKIHHRSESMKDDDPDAIANCCWSIIRSSKPIATIKWV